MIDRFASRQIYTNSEKMYETLFRERNVKQINLYTSPEYTYPDADSLKTVSIIEHVWSIGDRYYKLANKYYGDPRDWWIIAKFNNKPTESHVKLGEILLIPTPLQNIISIMKG